MPRLSALADQSLVEQALRSQGWGSGVVAGGAGGDQWISISKRSTLAAFRMMLEADSDKAMKLYRHVLNSAA